MKFVICIGWIIKGTKKTKFGKLPAIARINAIDDFVYHTVEMINENWLGMKLFIFFVRCVFIHIETPVTAAMIALNWKRDHFTLNSFVWTATVYSLVAAAAAVAAPVSEWCFGFE